MEKMYWGLIHLIYQRLDLLLIFGTIVACILILNAKSEIKENGIFSRWLCFYTILAVLTLRVGLAKQQELYEGLESRIQIFETISHQNLKQPDEIGSEILEEKPSKIPATKETIELDWECSSCGKPVSDWDNYCSNCGAELKSS